MNEDLSEVRSLYGRVKSARGEFGKAIVDGFCPFCTRDSAFRVDGISISNGTPWDYIKTRNAHDQFSISCTREDQHKITFFVEVRSLKIQKIGQIPSVADIAIDEARQKFRSVLKGDNWAEFYKAIGLAAHGEGIGSFVYLRRVFERLIYHRFTDHKDDEGWNEGDFRKLPMDKKIDFLRDFLPPYLVSAQKLYSIFSLGIHELDNEKCLLFFDIGKRSIIIILEEDLRIREAVEEKRRLSDAIAKFEGKATRETTC